MSLSFAALRLGCEWSGKLYPDGSFGVTRRVLKKVERSHDPLMHLTKEERGWNCRRLRIHGLSNTLSFVSESHETRGETDGERSETLGLSNVAKSHRTNQASSGHLVQADSPCKLPRGNRGLSSYGRRLIQGCVSLLESKCPRRTVSFLTLTLPSLKSEEGQLIALQWSELLRRVVQSLGRRLTSRQLPAQFAGAIELQERRQSVHGGIHPHLHLVFRGRKTSKSSWVISPEECREIWGRHISQIIGRTLSPKELKACENLVMVKKSASRYLSKYLSKGVSPVIAITEGYDSNHIPKCWYTVSFELRREWKKNIRSIPAEMCQWLMQLCFDNDKETLIYGHVVRLAAYGNVPIGCGGILRNYQFSSA